MSELGGLWEHENNQHAPVPPKTECGCPSGGGIKNGRIRYSSSHCSEGRGELNWKSHFWLKKKIQNSKIGVVLQYHIDWSIEVFSFIPLPMTVWVLHSGFLTLLPFFMRAILKGLTFGLCLYGLCLCNVHVLSKPWGDPVQLAGLV